MTLLEIIMTVIACVEGFVIGIFLYRMTNPDGIMNIDVTNIDKDVVTMSMLDTHAIFKRKYILFKTKHIG